VNTSPELSNIATALNAFQSEVEDAHKASDGHNYRYADLPTILQLIRPLMGKHGLALVQFPVGDALNVGIVSRLIHVSGEWMEETMYMGITESRGMSSAQAAGAVITYCRRYAAAAILGISQVDNDAHVEEPEIEPASEEQFAEINDFISEGKVPARRLKWLQVTKNWQNLTDKQATIILTEIKEKAK